MQTETTKKKQSDLLSFTQVRNNYNRHINSACFYYLQAEITKKKTKKQDNTKLLYKIIAKLTNVQRIIR